MLLRRAGFESVVDFSKIVNQRLPPFLPATPTCTGEIEGQQRLVGSHEIQSEREKRIDQQIFSVYEDILAPTRTFRL